MKHRSRRASFLSFSSRRRRRRHRGRSDRSWSTTALHEGGGKSSADMEIDVSQILFEDSDAASGSHIQELERRSSSLGSMIPFIDASYWLGTTGDVSLSKLPATISSVCKWCSMKVHQSLEYAKDVVFPSRVYWRELTSTKDQLASLQEQLKKLTEDMQSKNPEGKSPNTSRTSDSSCNCCPLHSPCNTSGGTCNNSSITTPVGSNSLAGAATQAPPTAASQPLLAPPPPPPPPAMPPLMAPPPPPPPPPPLVKAPASQDWRKNLPKKKDGAKKQSKENSRPVVTLDDIKGVKLKKVTSKQERQVKPQDKGRGPLVSLSDLQNIQLRRSSRRLSDPKEPELTMRARLGLEALEFRTSLKKIGLPRSPGGTPYRSKPVESGVGLTPIMARALKRKFRSFSSPSGRTSPRSNGSSPEISISPGLRI
ncbi:proline-rich protein 11-like [Diadema antillarum]|uniref:proline-rich protein 11-like n=1 Tax=Diadema antillarum TaxID=105358 RepID=UPI003A852ABE